MACFRAVNCILRKVQHTLFSKNASHRLVFKEQCYGSKWYTRPQELQGATHCFVSSPRRMFQPTVNTSSRQSSSDPQPSTCNFTDGKEYLSHVLREISDINFSPEHYVNIFEKMSDFGESVWHETRHDTNLYESVYKQGVEIQDGTEFDQLIVGLQSHIYDLQISSLTNILYFLVQLGIPAHNKVLSLILERLLDKEAVLSWQDLEKVCILTRRNVVHHHGLFSAHVILPKVKILLSNEDMEDRNTIISMIRVLSRNQNMILPCTNILRNCTYCIHKHISDDQLLQNPIFLIAFFEFLSNNITKTVGDASKLPDDVYIMWDVIMEKLINSFIRVNETFSISELSLMQNLIERKCRGYPRYRTMLDQISSICFKKCWSELQDEDIDIKRLSNMSIPLFKSYPSEFESELSPSEFDDLITDQVKHADITVLIHLVKSYVYVGKTCSQRLFEELLKRVLKDCKEKGMRDTLYFLNCVLRLTTYNEHLREILVDYDVKNEIIASFGQCSYTNELVGFMFLNVLRSCHDDMHIPQFIFEKFLTALPGLSIFTLRKILRVLKKDNRPWTQDYYFLYQKIIFMFKRKLQENPSFSLAMTIINSLLTEGRPIELDYENLVRIVPLLPEIMKKMRMWELSRHFNDFSGINFYDCQLLEFLESFVIRNSIHMIAFDIILILKYMYRVGHDINNPEFESICLEKIENGFDCSPACQQIHYVTCLCENGIYPEKLISRIFSLEYLQGLDRFFREKSFYVKECGKLERNLVYLNRTLVLECPQLQVPWLMDTTVYFGKEIQAIKSDQVLTRRKTYSKEVRITSGILPKNIFRDQVDQILSRILEDGCYKRNIRLPYHYRADFDMYLNEQSSPLLYVIGEEAWTSNHTIQRIAVLLLSETEFCFNSRRLKGSITAQTRQLQIAGFKVIHIPHYEWNSMAISTTKSKKKYLKEKIFSTP